MSDLVLNLAVLGAVAVATVTDLRARRIPNLLTLPTMLGGLVLNLLFGGPAGLQESVAGCALGLGLLLPLFMLRGMGAGDVKLMGALGALKGPEFVFFTCLWAGIAGGIVALVGLLGSGKLKFAASHLAFTLFQLAAFRGAIPGGPADAVVSVGRIPYAPAIAVGATLVLGGVRWIGW